MCRGGSFGFRTVSGLLCLVSPPSSPPLSCALSSGTEGCFCAPPTRVWFFLRGGRSLCFPQGVRVNPVTNWAWSLPQWTMLDDCTELLGTTQPLSLL